MPFRRAAVALLLGLAAPAWSLTEPGSHILNIGMGGGVPLMDIDLATAGGGRERLGSSGLAAGAQYLYQATPAIGVGLDLAGMRFADHEHQLSQSIAASGGSLFTAQAILRILLLPESRVTPFILGGSGMSYFNANMEARPKPGFAWADTRTTETRRLIDKGAAGYAVTLGGGMEGRIGETGLLGVEGRWTYASIDRDTFGTKGARTATVFARLGWVFGG